MDNRNTVTVSNVTEQDLRDGGKSYFAAVYVECSFCRELDHLMKIDFYWERGKEGGIDFSSVDFSFPSEWYVHQPWTRVKPWPWRLFQVIEGFLRRVRLACLVLIGKEIRLSPVIDLELPVVRDLANKLSHLSTTALRDEGAKRAE